MNPDLSKLTLLAQFLKTVPASHFNLDSWRAKGEDQSIPDHALHDCNTQACAIGWACASPQFQAMGLKFHRGLFFGYPEYQGYQSWDAVENFFGLTWDQAHYLFDSAAYSYMDEQTHEWIEATLNDVITRLEEFIDEHSKTATTR